LQHEPSGLLGNIQVLSELDGRYVFFERGVEVDSIESFLERHMAIAKHGADFDGELFTAVTALE
jgi:hypothetical protein